MLPSRENSDEREGGGSEHPISVLEQILGENNKIDFDQPQPFVVFTSGSPLVVGLLCWLADSLRDALQHPPGRPPCLLPPPLLPQNDSVVRMSSDKSTLRSEFQPMLDPPRTP